MSSTDPVTRTGKGAAPEWDEKWMRAHTRRLVIAGIGAIVGIWIFLIIWVLFIAPIEDAPARPMEIGADLALVLAPVLAAALGVERLLETVFNMIEGAWRTAVAYLGYGMRWLKTAETEVAEARQWVQSMGTVYNGTLAAYNQKMKDMLEELKLSSTITSIPDQMDAVVRRLREEGEEKAASAKLLLEDAQRRLKEAENKLASAANSPDYRSAKSAVTIVLGLMLGVIIAAVGQIQAFALLGIAAVPPRIDVLITGLVIGSGSYPVHSVVGILQQTKDAIDGLGNFLNNRAAPTVKATEQTITTVQPTAPGQPPHVGQAVIQTTTAQAAEPAAGG
jgi:hypothetical protein